ncbi:hypothetical protein LCGC14_0480250 [marine sediment metagenome]|uniref:Glycosyl transferase family 1 domain-containing protein n=1 Tax=marine sediment metagenome TaxID=412755 RepID=A0A0F9SSP3_9ZZZZ|nr:glycosyltransferase [Methylophaga sp.]
MKILLLAEVCNPNWPSLPDFSYSLAKYIAKHTEVVLVTHIRNKQDIEQYNDFSEIVFIDNEYIASPLHKISNVLQRLGVGGMMTNMALKYPANIVFEYEVYKKFKARLKNNEFDLIHRISPVSPTVPSPIASWSDIPFIYGPLNGALAWPKQYKEVIKKEREILIHVRGLYKFLPYYKSTFVHSVKILAAFKHVEKEIPEKERHKIVRFNELGVDTDLYRPADIYEVSSAVQSCQFLFVGRLVPLKCAHVVIMAFAESKFLRENHKLKIVGDGPERESLEKLIEQFNLYPCVEILGWKNQAEVAQYMRESDVFVFPTIREAGGNVLLEAMSSGLPSIVPNYGGPAELIDDTVGIKVDLSDKEQFQQDYIKEMELLAEDLKLRNILSINAREQALKRHDWRVKGEEIKQIYNSIILDDGLKSTQIKG